MKYIVYLTTNKVNNKIYIGVHQTENPDKFDGYLGCGIYVNSPKTYKNGGTLFQRAVNKYGPNNFYRKTLHVYDNLKEAEEMEAHLVNYDFISRTDTYNMTLGGNIPPLLTKKVYQFDLKGNLIKEWNSRVEVTRHYNTYDDLMLNCIKMKRSFMDYLWSDDPQINIEEYRLSRTKCIYQYNMNGLLLNIFDNIKETSMKLDIDPQRLQRCITDRLAIDDCYFLTANQDIKEVLEYRKNKNNGKKKVYRYFSSSGKFDREFDSVANAAKDVNKKSNTISYAIKNFSNSDGYKYSFIKSDIFQEVSISPEITPQKVEVLNLDGERIEIFETVTECQKKYPNCRRVLRGERKSTNKCIFKYIS